MGKSLNISLVATLGPLQKSIEAVGKMMADFASSIEKTDSKLSASIKASVATMNTELSKVKQSFDGVGQSGEKSAKGAGSLRTQLRAATMEAQQAAQQFGRFSPQFIDAARRAAQIKDEMGDVAQSIDAMNPDEKFKGVAKVLDGVMGGMMAVQGAMAAFGVESEDAQKTMAKLQGLMAMSDGLNKLGGLSDSMGDMKTKIVAMTQGMGGFQKALMATGIGLFVVALGAVAANWDKIKGAVDGVSAEQKKLTELSAEHVKKEQDKLAFIEGQDNVYKMQGKTERQILAIKIAQTAEVIRAAEIQIQHHKDNLVAQIAASKRNRDILIAMLDSIMLPAKMVLNVIDMAGKAIGKNFGLVEKLGTAQKKMAEWIFDPAETEKKGKEEIQTMEKTLAEMKNKKAGYQLAVQSLDKKEADKRTAAMLEANKKASESWDAEVKKMEEAYEGFYLRQAAINDKIKAGVKLAMPAGMTTTIKTNAVGNVGNKNMIADFGKDMEMAEAASRALTAAVQDLALNGFMLLGEAIGAAVTGAGSLESFFNSILLMVADTAKQLGQQFIKMGTAMIIIKTQLIANPYAAVAAGVALVAAGAAAKNIIANQGKSKPKLASGGIAMGEVDVTVGEYPGANSNPEVIAPLSKLKSMIGGDNNRPQQLYSTIYGGQLIMATNKASGNYRRINGRVR